MRGQEEGKAQEDGALRRADSSSTPLGAAARVLNALVRAERDELAGCLAPGASFVGPGGLALSGPDSIAAGLLRWLPPVPPASQGFAMEHTDRLAVLGLHWHSEPGPPATTARSAQLDATAVFRREDDGWLLTLFALDTGSTAG